MIVLQKYYTIITLKETLFFILVNLKPFLVYHYDGLLKQSHREPYFIDVYQQRFIV
jgi:hypothetical protein